MRKHVLVSLGIYTIDINVRSFRESIPRVKRNRKLRYKMYYSLFISINRSWTTYARIHTRDTCSYTCKNTLTACIYDNEVSNCKKRFSIFTDTKNWSSSRSYIFVDIVYNHLLVEAIFRFELRSHGSTITRVACNFFIGCFSTNEIRRTQNSFSKCFTLGIW